MNKTAEELRNEFWDKDKEQGGVIFSQYETIKKVLKTGDMDWIQQQYNAIKVHAIQMTDFYKSYCEDDQFPVVNKTFLIEHKDECTAKGGFMNPLHISSTSGSTGTPFSVVQDYMKRKRTIADLKVFGELCDYPSHERMVFYRVINEKLHRTPEQEDMENIYYIDSSDLGSAHLEEMRKALIEKKPRIIFSYASTLVELARYIDSVSDSSVNYGLTSVLTAGEGISDNNRLFLQKVFGCKVYRRYSDMELGILGQDMGDGGSYTLNWGSYYFECLKKDSDEPAESGEVGRIVITDLFNYAFPMIRYDTGDLGLMEYPQDSTLPRLKEILGRSRDCVYTVDGRLLSPAKISVSMWGAEGIRQWQFIQEDEKEYTLKINADLNTDTDQIIKKLITILGETAVINIKFVDEIPVVSSNKRRAVICNYKKSNN
ncbi:MAG: hypothetical protein Q4F95_03875 [Oscillospiraceae bacterium]|nr:hypothetical protein [Oscillospiraceae bacterium]